MRDQSRIKTNLSTWVVLMAIFISGSAQAASEYDRVCNAAAMKDAASERASYCDAAKIAKRANGDESKLWKVWTGVAVVCTASCVASFFGPVTGSVCTVSNVAGTVADAALTKQFSSAIMALGQYTLTHSASSAVASTAAKGASHRNLSACMSAASAGMQAMSKNKAANSSKDSMLSSLALAGKLESGTVPSDLTHTPHLPSTPGRRTGADRPLAGGGGVGSSPVIGEETKPSDNNGSEEMVCNTGSSSATPGSAGGLASCAIALDSNLPEFIKQPEFDAEFEKATGTPFKDFLAQSPGDANNTLASLMSGSMADGAAQKLSEVIQQLDHALPDSAIAGAKYASHGGGSASAPKEDAEFKFDLGALFGAEGGPALGGNEELNFEGRSPASTSNESSDIWHRGYPGTIFEIVTKRLGASRDRVENLKWATPLNRALTR